MVDRERSCFLPRRGNRDDSVAPACYRINAATPRAAPAVGRRSEAMFEPLVAAVITRGTQLFTGVRGRWIGCEPSQAQRIYYANHTSHMDFLLLWSALPANLRAKTRPVAAEDYWSRDAIRRYMGTRVFH